MSEAILRAAERAIGTPDENRLSAAAVDFADGHSPRYKTNATRFYVASFCEDGNLLSQWRAYGQGDSSALSIGFNSNLLAARACEAFSEGQTHSGGHRHLAHGQTVPKLHKVIYDVSQQSALLDFAISTSLTCSKLDWMHTLMLPGLLKLALIPVAPLIKHPMFAEEREWRLVYAKFALAKPPFGFRSTRRGVAPYILCPLTGSSPGSPRLLPIEELRQGPSERVHLHLQAAQDMLLGFGYSDEISLTASDIPLRG